MANPIVAMMQQHIGQKIQNSPSNVSNWLAGTIRAVEEGKITLEFKVRDEMLNPNGNLHGGMAALMIDELIGMTVYTVASDKYLATVNLAIDYIANVKRDQTVLATAEVLRMGRNIAHAVCEIRDTEGKLLAKAASNLVAIPPRPAQPA